MDPAGRCAHFSILFVFVQWRHNSHFYPRISNLATMEMCETTFILLTPLCTLRANAHLLIRLYFLRNILLFSQIGHLHDDVILLPRPESFRFLLNSCANQGFCYLNLAGFLKFKYERKSEKHSGRSSKMTPSCEWPIS